MRLEEQLSKREECEVNIEERAINLAHYIIDTGYTVSETAKKFGISKSTVHRDINERLSKVNPDLAAEVRKILNKNKNDIQQQDKKDKMQEILKEFTERHI